MPPTPSHPLGGLLRAVTAKRSGDMAAQDRATADAEKEAERQRLAKREAMQMSLLDLQRRQAEQGLNAPPPTRNIDPLSPEGIKAQLELAGGRPAAPRNIDPLSPEGVEAQLRIARGRPPSPSATRAQRPTEVQGKAAFNLTRARAASQQLAQYDNVKALDAAASKIPLIGNWIKTPEGRKLHNVGQAWVISVLRQDSGGAITDNEMEQYFETYLPVPGDDEATLAQKRENRRVIEQALEGLAGPALPKNLQPAPTERQGDPEIAEVEAAFKAGPDTPARRAQRDQIVQAIRAKRGGE